MDVLIREYQPTDAAEICKLNKDQLGYDFPLGKTIRKLDQASKNEDKKIFVALFDDTVVGYVHAVGYDVVYAPHIKNLMGIAVNSKYQNHGIGKKLLETVEQWAADTGAYGVRLNSGEDRKNSHTFYEHCGYTCNKKQLNLKKVF